MRKRTKRRLRYSDQYIRHAEYSQKTTGYLPNAQTLTGAYKAAPGDFLEWRFPNADGSWGEPHYGRMLATVDAHRQSPDVEAVKGHIAVLELAMEFRCCFVRWVDPAWVRHVSRKVPQKMVAWFLGIGNDDPVKNGDLETILRLSSRGSLSEEYVDSIEYCPECQSLLGLGREHCPSESSKCSIAAKQREEREAEHAKWLESKRGRLLTGRAHEGHNTTDQGELNGYDRFCLDCSEGFDQKETTNGKV